MHLTYTLVLIAAVFLIINMLKVYSSVPIIELKRRARGGEAVAKTLYKAASYGKSLRILLWLFLGICSAGLFLELTKTFNFWLAYLIVLILIWLTFVWIPNTRVGSFSRQTTVWLSPFLAAILSFVHPVSDKINRIAQRVRPVNHHTGMYEREDFLRLMELQGVQYDNRIDQFDLELAHRALTFSDRKVRDVLIPRRVVKMVKQEEPIGPILMTELHDSGHSRFPVYDGKKNNIVGILYLRDLINAKHTGTVKGVMHPTVSFIHEEQSLYDALQAILKTHQQLFIVINSFEEYVGVLSIEDVFENIIGKPIMDEFDQYQDLRAVASRAAKKDHKAHLRSEKDSLDVIEVIE